MPSTKHCNVKREALTGSTEPVKSKSLSSGVDLSSFEQPLAEISTQISTSTSTIDEVHEVKWNGEVVRVEIPGLRSNVNVDFPRSSIQKDKFNALDQQVLYSSSEAQWSGSTYKLKNLMRIRPYADTLRHVNSACEFVAVSSTELSDSEEESNCQSPQIIKEESKPMPVFFKDDRVLFRANKRRFRGTVQRRIRHSDFYHIRADNGTLFRSVLALNIELLDEPRELRRYDFAKGDQVLWVPHSNTPTTSSRTIVSRSDRRRDLTITNDELTFKAKVVQLRSLERYDLLLRSGRVAKKVPYEQLRPRIVSNALSTTMLRRR